MAEHVIEVKVSELPEVVREIKRLEAERVAYREALRDLHDALTQYGAGNLKDLPQLFRAMEKARALLEEPTDAR